MTHVKIVIDGRVEMDADPGEWQNTAPTKVQHLIRPSKGELAFMPAVRAAFLEAVMKQDDVVIDATTNLTGWNVRVTRKPQESRWSA